MQTTAQAPLMVSVSGCRGILGKTMTPEVASRFAAAFASFLRERALERPGRDLNMTPITVAIGRDGRKGGNELQNAAIRGLLGSGCRVIDMDVAMTATIGFAVDQSNADGGLVITASHNPQEWNGLKCIIGGGKNAHDVGASAPPAAIAREIIARFQEGRATTGRSGELDAYVDAPNEHADLVSAIIDDLAASAVGATGNIGGAVSEGVGSGFKVVLDSVNASGAVAGWRLLAELGCEVTHLNAEGTGVFPHPPEPTAENLKSLGEAVKKERAAVGFAQDPDADRLAIVDETGAYIGEEYTIVLAAEALLSSGALGDKPSIAVNLSTSRMIDDVAAKYGAKVVRTPVGEANVVEAMKRERCELGGEGNGGVIWPRIAYIRDSLSAMALVLKLMKAEGKPLSKIVAGLPKYAIVKRKSDLARAEDAARAAEAVAKAFPGAKIDRQDGVRVDLPEQRAWVHVRASNTEPIMRLIAEAPTEAEAKRVLDTAQAAIAGA